MGKGREMLRFGSHLALIAEFFLISANELTSSSVYHLWEFVIKFIVH
jgi:hypothetical protein